MGENNSWPPGFRFHPTDEELILYYLKRKMCRRSLKLDIIAELDVYKHEPEELPGLSLLKNGDRQWFFFSPRDRKYPNGLRSNRSTRQGYWKTTGKDRKITCNSRNVGVKKTLVFYRGRAPSAKRTDWVMHEYTFDEDELRKCQNAQDYYAIYKLFKKSGPGPKNGEQYGALFREEDWVDDDECPETTSNNNQINHAREVNDVLVTDNCRNEEAHLCLDDIDDVVNHIIAEPAPQPAHVYDSEAKIFDFEHALSQFVGEEETPPSTIIHASSGEELYPESCSTTYPLAIEQNGLLEGSFNVSQVTATELELWDVADVTSAANIIQSSQHTAYDNLIEMDDFLGADHVHSHSGLGPPQFSGNNLSENSQLSRDIGLGDFDLLYDADLLLYDLLPGNQAMPSNNLCPQSHEGGIVDLASSERLFYPNSLNAFGSDMWHSDASTYLLPGNQAMPSNNLCPLSHEGGIVDLASSEMLFYPNSLNAFGSEMWHSDASTYLPTSAELNQEPVPFSTTGVVYDGNSASISTDPNPNQGRKEVEDSQPWFSSTLWSFVESIPAAFASAAESALVNKAFLRMSSFSRLRLSAISINATADKVNASASVSASASAGFGSRVKGLFFISFLVAIFAVVCVCWFKYQWFWESTPRLEPLIFVFLISSFFF